MGGDCLYTGCVPSKSLLRSGHVKRLIDEASDFGIKDASASVDFPAVMDRIRKIIARIEPHDSPERFTSLGVECVSGQTKIESPYVVSVGDRKIATRSIILATGARPLTPPIPGLDQVDYLTSDSVWNLESLPERLLVVGGRPSAEMLPGVQQSRSRITQVEMAPRILFREDPEVSECLPRSFGTRASDVLDRSQVVRSAVTKTAFHGSGERRRFRARAIFDRVRWSSANEREGFGLKNWRCPLTPGGSVERSINICKPLPQHLRLRR